jgi:predicted kinase
MKRIILTKGLPASGKTTYAKEILKKGAGAYKRVNKDDLRAMLDDGNWSGSNERFVLKIRDQIILQAIGEGKHVIVDDTNLNPIHEQHIRDLVKGLGVVEIADFTHIPVEECIARDQKRTVGRVGEKVIKDMYKKYLKPNNKVPVDHTLPPAIICDIDGTLAIMDGRSPFEWLRVKEDKVNRVIKDLLARFDEATTIIMVSGRDSVCRELTTQWLEENGIRFNALYMRDQYDARKDSIVKRDIFDNHIRGKFNVKFVLDDRNQVVEMWRDLGLTCLQVAEGDF